MKTTKHLFSILLLCMLIQGCDKDSSPCTNSEINIYYNIADSNKAKIPYTGSDTLIFISNQGDTAKLIGQGKKTYYTIKSINTSGNADCQKMENRNYENTDIVFTGENQKLFKLYYRIAKSDFDPINLTGIEINFNDQYRVGSTVENTFYYLTKDDSILINNQYKIGGFIDNNKTLLYSNELGILRINFSGALWTKNK